MIDEDNHEVRTRVSEEHVSEEHVTQSAVTNTNPATIPEEDEPMFTRPSADIDKPPEDDVTPMEVAENLVIVPTNAQNVIPTSPNEDDIPVVSQVSYDSEDETNDPTSSKDFTTEDAATINAAFDPIVEGPEIASIVDHQFNGGKLEFLCEYDNGDREWHPIDMVKLDDLWTIAN